MLHWAIYAWPLPSDSDSLSFPSFSFPLFSSLLHILPAHFFFSLPPSFYVVIPGIKTKAHMMYYYSVVAKNQGQRTTLFFETVSLIRLELIHLN